MSTNDAGLSDEVAAEVNPAGEAPEGQPARIPDRPAAGARSEKWAGYVVALGVHPDEASKRTRGEMIELADRLGG